MHDPVAEWATVRALATGDRPRNAYEFSSHLIAREPNCCIAMAAQIDELEMRREAGVREGSRALQIETLGIFQAGSDAVLQQHVVRPIGPGRAGAVDQEQRPERMILFEAMLHGLHGAGARERGADETQAYRVKLARRQFRGRVAGPEAVPVARDDCEAGNPLVAHQVVNLGALPTSGSIVAAPQRGIGRLRPWFP